MRADRYGAARDRTINAERRMSSFTSRVVAVAAIAAIAAACTDLSGTSGNTLALSAAFQTVPAGFSASSNTFDASGDDGVPFLPGMMDPAVGFDRGGNSGSGGGGGEHGRGHDDGDRDRDHHD